MIQPRSSVSSTVPGAAPNFQVMRRKRVSQMGMMRFSNFGRCSQSRTGDTSMADKSEVEKLIKGGGARVQR